MDSAAPANTPLMLEYSTTPLPTRCRGGFSRRLTQLPGACTTDSTKDYVCKVKVDGLTPNTVYFYRFVGPAGEMSNIGKFKTAPDSSTSAPLHFAFSGDNDGLIRPYALASVIPSQNLDFYVNLGDVIYENASNLTTSGAHNGQPWLNSPSVTLSGASSSLNGVPTSTGFATQAQLKADYEKKYRENFLPVNVGGQNSLQVLYAAQGNYTTWDNHELGNRQYINGGAPAGGSVGGAAARTCRPAAASMRANNGAGNPGNVNDVNNSTERLHEPLDWIPDASECLPELPADRRPRHGQRSERSAHGRHKAALFRPAVGQERDLHQHRLPLLSRSPHQDRQRQRGRHQRAPRQQPGPHLSGSHSAGLAEADPARRAERRHAVEVRFGLRPDRPDRADRRRAAEQSPSFGAEALTLR